MWRVNLWREILSAAPPHQWPLLAARCLAVPYELDAALRRPETFPTCKNISPEPRAAWFFLCLARSEMLACSSSSDRELAPH